MPFIFLIAGILSVLAGLVIAATAIALPGRRSIAEKVGGGLFLAGLALLGVSFPIV
jgi:hypothetical protein